MISVQPDMATVALEDEAYDLDLARRESDTASIVALADRIGSQSSGLLLSSERIAYSRLRTYFAPIRWNDSGVIRPIDPRWKQVDHPDYIFACLYSGTAVGLDNTGWRYVRGDGFHFRTRPNGIYIGQASRITAETAFPTRRVNANRLRVDGLWPFGIPSYYQITRLGVKEGLLLPQSLSGDVPAQATTVRFRYDYERISGSMTAQLSVDASEIHLFESGRFVGVLNRPWVQDSAGKRQNCTYNLGSGWIEVAVDAAWLRDPSRQWPILLDPTVTSSSQANTCALEDSGSNPDDQWAWITQIDLPDIGAGSTLNSASLFARLDINGWDANTLTLTVLTSSDVSWTSASTISTINALTTFNSGIAVNLNNASATSTWYEWEGIEGTTLNAQTIASAYDASTNPGSWTIRINSNLGSATQRTVSGALAFSKDEEDYSLAFAGSGDPNQPYLEIDYTAAPSVNIPAIMHHRQQQRMNQ